MFLLLFDYRPQPHTHWFTTRAAWVRLKKTVLFQNGNDLFIMCPKDLNLSTHNENVASCLSNPIMFWPMYNVDLIAICFHGFNWLKMYQASTGACRCRPMLETITRRLPNEFPNYSWSKLDKSEIGIHRHSLKIVC